MTEPLSQLAARYGTPTSIRCRSPQMRPHVSNSGVTTTVSPIVTRIRP